ncbi:hypothetical protein [Streptomyces sp. NBC_00557]|uniref:hypothetical protein n=1 Tax=Streptomyces sp. NBC_00557 TaxID=2975776 RepID=UPI002E813C54|nr:hypothetical protein [Streptomyces sp. NBC_00557]WUC39506.1 hypothetical protein OG956_37545 [Streptomyces sp. NBC_00557]
MRLLDADLQPLPYVTSGGGFGEFVFVQELPDVDWAFGSGSDVGLDAAVSPFNEDGIVELLYELDSMGWTSAELCWNIQQSDANWHGAGAREFVEALRGWKKREESLDDAHHTENQAGGLSVEDDRGVQHQQLARGAGHLAPLRAQDDLAGVRGGGRVGARLLEDLRLRGPLSTRSQSTPQPPEYGEFQAHTVVPCRSARACAKPVTTVARVRARAAYSRSGDTAPLGRPRTASQSTPGMSRTARTPPSRNSATVTVRYRPLWTGSAVDH